MEPSTGEGRPRAARGSFVAETRFDGAIVSCLWPRELVTPVLPGSLHLETPANVPRGSHPVVFIFGQHHRSRVFFASLALETGVRFLEFVIAVPFVRETHSGTLATFLPRVFSGEPVVTWSGNAHYGYAKRMVPMEWLGDTFVVSDDDSSLLAHAKVEGIGRWGTIADVPGPVSASALGLPKLPVLGSLADGSLMTSWFDWGFDGAWARPARAWVSIDADLGAGLGPQVAYGAESNCVAVRDMAWRLTWPERLRAVSTAAPRDRYQKG